MPRWPAWEPAPGSVYIIPSLLDPTHHSFSYGESKDRNPKEALSLGVSSLPALHFLRSEESHIQAALTPKNPNLMTAEMYNSGMYNPPSLGFAGSGDTGEWALPNSK